METRERVVDFEASRPLLAPALAYPDGANGSRPPDEPVTMLEALIFAAQNNASDA
ncbi:hypothetical protein [Sphingomonas sp.]|uniref:hypothetical protein n=1 Tax=Sphingomonas sp. TaxID=28214 RepID=UPI00286A7082|nr:hypothetical protein [Sphingomonas sp.]